MQPSAKVIADSISPEGVRLTTVELVCHRFVLSEFNTHRVFSRNSASSRAIPVEKMLKRFSETPAWPLEWPAEQKGMQGGEGLEDAPLRDAQALFASLTTHTASALLNYLEAHPDKASRLHKSLLNRLMEWGQWHTIVCTSTAWGNFFNQRCSPLAQPEIRAVAEAIREAMMASTPREVQEGTWHRPYVDVEDLSAIADLLRAQGQDPNDRVVLGAAAARVSAARCARTSYETQDGKRDPQADLALYERLIGAKPEPHWSPLEHVATPWRINRQRGGIVVPLLDGTMRQVNVNHLPRVGNLLQWRSLRTAVEAEMSQVTFR